MPTRGGTSKSLHSSDPRTLLDSLEEKLAAQRGEQARYELIRLAAPAARACGMLARARELIREGFEIARRVNSVRKQASMLQFGAALAAEVANYAVARRLSILACLAFLKDSDLDGAARCFVDQAQYQSLYGHPHGALRDLRTAARTLSPSDRMNHIAILSTMANLHIQRGEPLEATQMLEDAERLCKPSETEFLAKVQWLRGRAAYEAGLLDLARECLQSALGPLFRSPGDTSLIINDLIRVAISKGDTDEESRLRKKLGCFARLLPKSKLRNTLLSLAGASPQEIEAGVTAATPASPA